MENFNNFFTEIGPKLANELEKPAKTFDVYLKKVDVLQPEYPLSINELKDTFFSLQKTKVQVMSKPLLLIFRLSYRGRRNFPR